MKCDNCNHKEVCKFKEEYEAATQRVKDSLGVSGPMSVEVKCEHFANAQVCGPASPMSDLLERYRKGGGSTGGNPWQYPTVMF